MNAATNSETAAHPTLGPPSIALICLHADPTMPPGWGEGGGTHSYLREILSFLYKLRSHHILLTRWADPDLPERQRISNYGVIQRMRIGAIGPMDKRRLNDFHDVTLANVRRATQDNGPIALLHSVYWNSGRAAMDLSAELGLPFVHTVISNGWRRQASGWHDQPPERLHIERQVFHAAHRVFCICTQERNDLMHAYHVSAKKLIVVGRPPADIFKDPSRNGYGQPRPKPPLVVSEKTA